MQGLYLRGAARSRRCDLCPRFVATANCSATSFSERYKTGRGGDACRQTAYDCVHLNRIGTTCWDPRYRPPIPADFPASGVGRADDLEKGQTQVRPMVKPTI